MGMVYIFLVQYLPASTWLFQKKSVQSTIEIVTYLGKHLRVYMTTKSASVCWTKFIIGLY